MKVGDDWAWVAHGAERQPVVAAAALEGAEDAPDVDEGAQAIPAPIYAPPPPPSAARPYCIEIDEVGEVSIIWNPMCDCSHAGI
nr:hypothetical protein [Tanacetum cinerariifolium]